MNRPSKNGTTNSTLLVAPETAGPAGTGCNTIGMISNGERMLFHFLMM